MLSKDKVQQSIQRTVHWALALLGKDGFAGAEGQLLALYKAPMVFCAAGCAEAAARTLNAAVVCGYRDGDFHVSQTVQAAIRGRSYRNAWLAWGANALGAYDLSNPTLDRLDRALQKNGHGIPDDDEAEPAELVYTAGATAQAANVFLACGRLQAAERAGYFLADLVLEQAEASDQILLARDASGHLLAQELIDQDETSSSWSFRFAHPNPVCWVVGLMLRVFARLFRATGDKTWLKAAEAIHGLLKRAHESAYSNITSAKLAWGAAEMAGVTGSASWQNMAQSIGGWLLTQQGDDGIWVRRPQYQTSSDQPLAVSIDTSLERLFYLIDINRALSMQPRLVAS